MNNIDFDSWGEELIADFIDLGICYQDESIAITPITFDSKVVDNWKRDLPKLYELALKVALQNRNGKTKPRQDLQDTAESFLGVQKVPGIIRPDTILVGEHLKILELNVESSLGGIWEVNFIIEHIKRNPSLKLSPNAYFPSPKEAFLQYIEDFKKQARLKGKRDLKLAMVGFSDFDRYDQDICQDMCQWITKETSFEAIYTRPELMHIRNNYMTDGSKLFDVIYKYGAFIYPPTKVAPMINMINQARKTKTIIINDPVDIFIEHKGILALLSEKDKEEENINKAELALIEKYIPWTRFLTKDSVVFQGTTHPMIQLLKSNKNNFALKRTNSYLGEYVFMGCEVGKNEWEDLIEKAVADSCDWIAQEALSSEYYDLNYYIPGKGTTSKKRRCVFSPFFFGTHFGGVMVRVENDPQKRVLSIPTKSNIGSAAVLVQ